MVYGNGTLGPELNTGNTVAYAVYKITATQANHFYVGCAIGETFAAAGGVTIDANNKVRRYTGNHLSQPVGTNQPTNQVFDGVDNFMRCALNTFNQPCFLYLMMRQVTWTGQDYFFDGGTSDNCLIYQKNTAPSPNIAAYAGGFSANCNQLVLNTWGVVRVLYSGAASKMIINDNAPITGNFGTNAMGGFTLGRNGTISARYGNLEIKEGILRSSTVGETAIYNYYATKYAAIIGTT
jgi:hypothetical protein